MSEILPISALLSQALVAFIIEFDNEFEHRVPHRTTNHGATPGSLHAPWLVSMVMWSKFLRFVREEGTSFEELLQLTQSDPESLQLWLTRLSRWWGYVTIESTGSSKRLNAGAILRPRPGGRKAIEVWGHLTALIEDRWRERFGASEIDFLAECLRAVAVQLDPSLPASLPILGYGLLTHAPQKNPGNRKPVPPGPIVSAANLALPELDLPHLALPDLALPDLLSKVLLAFAIEYEREATISLAISANVLRLFHDEEVAVRDLPRLSGVSKEAIATSLSFLARHSYATVKSVDRTKLATLTPTGVQARQLYDNLVQTIEKVWQANYGKENIQALRRSLERLAGGPTQPSPLFQGLKPYPDGWRAAVPKPETLPHYPMILHRGGFPDGS
jgi:hypothetical protein